MRRKSYASAAAIARTPARPLLATWSKAEGSFTSNSSSLFSTFDSNFVEPNKPGYERWLLMLFTPLAPVLHLWYDANFLLPAEKRKAVHRSDSRQANIIKIVEEIVIFRLSNTFQIPSQRWIEKKAVIYPLSTSEDITYDKKATKAQYIRLLSILKWVSSSICCSMIHPSFNRSQVRRLQVPAHVHTVRTVVTRCRTCLHDILRAFS